jgi:hypothetical protein
MKDDKFAHKLVDITDKIKNDKEFTISDFFETVGFGTKHTFDLISSLYEKNIITLSQIALRVVDVTGDVILQTFLFLPNMIGISF